MTNLCMESSLLNNLVGKYVLKEEEVRKNIKIDNINRLLEK